MAASNIRRENIAICLDELEDDTHHPPPQSPSPSPPTSLTTEPVPQLDLGETHLHTIPQEQEHVDRLVTFACDPTLTRLTLGKYEYKREGRPSPQHPYIHWR